MITLEPFSPMVGNSNPDLEKISAPQKVMLLMIAVGFILLVGLLAYLPSLASS